MNDHPSVRIYEVLEQQWESLRGDRAMPNESDINPEALKNVWDSCFLVLPRPGGFAYSHLGRALVDAYGDDLAGREITEKLVYPHPPSLLKTFGEVVRTGAPVTDESEFVNSRGVRIKYRSCVLPLGHAGREGVQFLLGGMKWKAYADAA